MAEQWERRERHVVTDTGPSVVDAADAIAALHRALSDYRLIAAEPPDAEVPPGAVTLSAAGGVLTVQIEHFFGEAWTAGRGPAVAEPQEGGGDRG
jgi:hypothetical protein